MAPANILVTGTNRGLGLEYVKQLVQQKPKHLFAACRKSSDELDKLAKAHPFVKIITLDVGNDSSIQAAYTQVAAAAGDEGLNLLINNVGVFDMSNSGTLETITREAMQSHFNINTAGTVMMVKTFRPLLKKAADKNKQLPLGSSRAAVINTSTVMSSMHSQGAWDTGKGNFCHYRASKAALNMVTLLMSQELQADGILVSSVNPGWVQTDMGGKNAALTPTQSVGGILKFIAGLNESAAGRMYNHDGSPQDS